MPGRMRLVVAVAVAGALAWMGLAVPAAGTTTAAGRLSGRVEDAGGLAVAGAAITATASPTGASVPGTTSDAAGRFSLAVPQGTYDLTVTAAGRSPVLEGRLRGVRVGADTRLKVVLVAPPGTGGGAPAPVSFTGTVRDGAGAALSGVAVSLWNPSAPPGPSYPNSSATTGADGAFTVRVAPGRYQVSISRYVSSGSATGPTSSFSLNAADVDVTADRRINLTVPLRRVAVAVRDQAGAPLAGARVQASGSGGSHGPDAAITVAPGVVATPSWSGSGQTDTSGRFVVTGLPTQALTVSAQPADHDLGAAVRTGLRVDGDTTVELVAPPAVRLEGVLTDHDGSAVAGATVRLTGPANPGAETVTAADGRYSLAVAPGSYSLFLAKGTQYTGSVPNRFFSAVVPIRIDGDRRQDLRVPAVRVPFHVTDPDGAPVAGAAVTVYNSFPSAPVELFPGGAGQGLRGGSVTTDANGDATLLVFDGETAFVSAQPPAGSMFAASLSSMPTLTASSNVTLQLRRTVALSGVVHATPAAGITVSATGSSSNSSVTTGADGAFRLRLPAGSSPLSIGSSGQTQSVTDRPDHWHLNTQPIELTGDRAIDLTPPFAHVAVRAYDTAGAALALDRVPYSIASTGLSLALGSGVTANYGYFDGTGVAESSTAVRLAVFRSVPFLVDARLRVRTGGVDSVSARGLVVDSDTDVALVMATTPGSDPSTPTSSTTTTTTTTTTSTTTTTAPTGGQPGTGTPAGQHGGGHGSLRTGYWALSSDGQVYNFGDAARFGDTTAGAVDLEPTPTGKGYWTLNRNGRVQVFGDATTLGDVDMSKLANGEQPASLSATPSGKGYWVFTNRGRALAFGDAPHLGDMGAIKLNGPVLGSVATPSGRGYYMVASDGGIFAFGDAAFAGSMGGTALNAPVQSLVPDADGAGYWLVASDGGIFAFGAPFKGSMGGAKLNKPISGMVRYGDGYLMVGADGGIFNFSSLPFSGSLGDKPPAAPVVAVAALP